MGFNTVHRQELLDTRNQLEQTGTPILGAVLNMVEYGSYINRKYYYKSYYSNYDRYYGPKGASDRQDRKPGAPQKRRADSSQ